MLSGLGGVPGERGRHADPDLLGNRSLQDDPDRERGRGRRELVLAPRHFDHAPRGLPGIRLAPEAVLRRRHRLDLDRAPFSVLHHNLGHVNSRHARIVRLSRPSDLLTRRACFRARVRRVFRTWRGLDELKGLRKLKYLEASGTKVTEQGVEALKKALPELRASKAQ